MQERFNSVGLSCLDPAHSLKKADFQKWSLTYSWNQADNALTRVVLYAEGRGPCYTSLIRLLMLTMWLMMNIWFFSVDLEFGYLKSVMQQYMPTRLMPSKNPGH